MDAVIRIAGHNLPLPAVILNALPQWWWQEVAVALQMATDEGAAQLSVPFGVEDRVMSGDDAEDAPSGWWCRFRLRRCGEVVMQEGAAQMPSLYGRRAVKVELADALTGQRYDATLLNLFFAGRICPDPDDSLEVLQLAGVIHEAFYGSAWPAAEVRA